MKEQIKKMREENGGFTLAELLIVVAIILVLVAIAIPVFTSALHNSKAAADEANCRAVYADLQADYLANTANSYDSTKAAAKIDGKTVTFSDGQTATLSDACKAATATYTKDHGWTVTYECTDGHADHTKSWGYKAPAANNG